MWKETIVGIDKKIWINMETYTEYDKNGNDKRGFNKKGIHHITGDIYNEEGYDRNTCIQMESLDYKMSDNGVIGVDQNLSEEDLINGFDEEFFRKDLHRNRNLIESHIKQRLERHRNDRERIQLLYDQIQDSNDYYEKYETLTELNYFGTGYITPAPPDLKKCLDDPYFFFCTDDNLTYISNKDININKDNKKIIPFTSARAGKLRFEDSGDNKHEIIIQNGKLISVKKITGKDENTFGLGDESAKPIDKIMENRKIINGGENKSGIGDISKLLQEEQNKIMQAPAEGITLITGVAGSGKTNVLLHRIQYLLWEQPGKKDENDIIFNQNKMLFLCFNKALQKYIESSIKNRFPKIIVRTIDQRFIDIFKKDFRLATLDSQQVNDVSLYQVKKRIKEFLDTIPNTSGFLNKIFKYKEERNTKKIKNELFIYDKLEKDKNNPYAEYIIHLNPTILDKIYGTHITKYNKEHILTRLYLLSISKIEKEDTKHFKLIIGNKEIPGLYVIDANNKGKRGINYTFNKPLYDHIFIDEVQDLSPLQIQIVNGFHKNSMTIAGDESQLIVTGSLKSDLSSLFGIKIANKYSLSTSHRTSQQTALFANEFLKKIAIKNSISLISFKGLKPLVKDVRNQDGEYNYLINKIKDLQFNEPDASICIMYPKKEDANECVKILSDKKIDCYSANGGTWNFSKKIHITNYHQAKGLEFDYIFICGMNEFDKWNIKNKNNIIYTLITRGIKRVFITIKSNKPKLFDGVNESTYIYQ